MVILIISLIVAAFIFGFFVGRNNPNLKAVNDMVGAGKVFVDAAGKLVKK